MIKKNLHIIIAGGGITLLNLWFDIFLIPGTYFFLDTLFYPFTEWKDFFSTSIWFYFIDLLKKIFGYALASKIFLFLIYGITIASGVYLSKWLRYNNLWKDKNTKFLDIICMLLVIYSPFFAQRFISQAGIALGGSLLLLGTVACLNIVRWHKQKQYLTIAAIAYGLALAIFPHAIFLIGLLLISLSLVFYKRILYFVATGVWAILLNANWLYGELFWSAQRVGQNIEAFNAQNIEAFSSSTLYSWPIEISHLLGYGFWVEKYHIITPDDLISYWWIFAIMIVWLILLGAYKMLLEKKYSLFIFLFILWGTSYILSLWISSEITAPLAWWMYENVPMYIGMREPQKWMGVMMIPYIIYFVLWASYLLSLKMHKYITSIIKYLLPCLVVIWSLQSLFAYSNQIRITDYPADRVELKEYLQTGHRDKQIVAFPWHSYMTCSWTRGIRIPNPISELMYPLNVIESDNIEIAGLYTNSKSEISKNIEEYLRSKDLSLLQEIDVSTILMMKLCADHENYEFLDESIDIVKVFESENFNVFEIK